jgi:hypothetical protein
LRIIWRKVLSDKWRKQRLNAAICRSHRKDIAKHLLAHCDPSYMLAVRLSLGCSPGKLLRQRSMSSAMLS